MSPILHPQLDNFLLGFVTACSLVAAVFFLRFWRMTRDFLFLAFAVFFAIQGAHNAIVLTLSHPNESHPWLFVLRLISVLVVLAAILAKNRR